MNILQIFLFFAIFSFVMKEGLQFFGYRYGNPGNKIKKPGGYHETH